MSAFWLALPPISLLFLKKTEVLVKCVMLVTRTYNLRLGPEWIQTLSVELIFCSSVIISIGFTIQSKTQMKFSKMCLLFASRKFRRNVSCLWHRTYITYWYTILTRYLLWFLQQFVNTCCTNTNNYQTTESSVGLLFVVAREIWKICVVLVTEDIHGYKTCCSLHNQRPIPLIPNVKVFI